MNAAKLSDALRAMGLDCDIEDRGKLAVIRLASHDRGSAPTHSVARGAGAIPGRDTRRAIVAASRASGFTNVCIEIQRADAAVPGD